MGEGGLAEAGRTMEKSVVERLAAHFCGFDVDVQVGYDFLLAGEIFQFPGADYSVQFLIFAFVCIVGVEIRHSGVVGHTNTNIVLFYLI